MQGKMTEKKNRGKNSVENKIHSNYTVGLTNYRRLKSTLASNFTAQFTWS